MKTFFCTLLALATFVAGAQPFAPGVPQFSGATPRPTTANYYGTGLPNGNLMAGFGSLYLQNSNGVFYQWVKTNSTGSSGWTAFSLNGSSYDPFGAATAATNPAVMTHDFRAIQDTNYASQLNGSFGGSMIGTFTLSNSLVTGTANPYRMGFNSGIGRYVSGNTAGQESDVELVSPFQNIFCYNNGYPALSYYNGSGGDYTFRFYRLVSTIPTANPNPTVFTDAGVRYGNIGAQQTVYAPFYGGSAGSMIDLPSHGQEVSAAMPRPWIGVNTDDTTGQGTDWNPLPVMTNYLYLTNMSYYFKTSSITAFLNNYGTAPNIWGDCGWENTNRTSDGVIQECKNLFPLGLSNEVNIVHGHGSTITLHIYHTARLPNQFPNLAATAPDTAFRYSLGGHFLNSYPSGIGAAAGYQTNFTYPAITPDTVAVDTLFFYTNGIDGLMDADTDEYGQQGYEHYRLASIEDAILYPQTKFTGRTYWRNWTWPDGSGNNGVLQPSTYTNTTPFPHKLWLGFFANHASTEVPFYANFISPDQVPSLVGSDFTTSFGMAYAQGYANMNMTNWPKGTFGFVAPHDTAPTISPTSWTNWYSIVGEFNFCSAGCWFTNTWDTNQNVAVTNVNFLGAWTDTTSGFPKPVFCDNFVHTGGVDYEGTNSLWVKQLADGFDVLACNLGTTSSNYNQSLVVPGGIATNTIYCATNIFAQTPYGSGLLTNKFIGTVGSASLAWVKLTPLRIGITNNGSVYWTSSLQAQ